MATSMNTGKLSRGSDKSKLDMLCARIGGNKRYMRGRREAIVRLKVVVIKVQKCFLSFTHSCEWDGEESE